MNDQDGPQINQ